MSAPHRNLAIFVPNIGCPHRCSFCDQRAISGGARMPTPKEVGALCERALTTIPDGTEAEIAFFGGSFTAIPREQMVHLLKAAGAYLRDGGFSGIRISTRPDAVGDEVLDVLLAYGVTAIELGAQSMDDRVLAVNGRHHTAEDTAQAAERVKRAGFSLGLQMMTGLPGADMESDKRTAREIIALMPDTARIYPTLVLKNTEIERWYRRGDYRPETLDDAVTLAADLRRRFMEAGIRVIRVGLQAGRALEAELVAGPYHPAFGELCDARRFREDVLEKLRKMPPGRVALAVNPRDVSKFLGQRRENLAFWRGARYEVRLIQDGRVVQGTFDLTANEEDHACI